MGKIAVVTDSNSGITQEQAREYGINVLPMPFFINGETFFEDIDLTQEQFYEKLEGNAEISTSMPAVGSVTDLWDKLLEEYDEIVHIPMSSGLSSSCETAMMLSQDYDGKVQVVNNQRISVTQKQSVMDAAVLAEQGKSAAEIKNYGGHAGLSEKRRQDYACRRSIGHSAEIEAGASDSGRKAGRFCQSQNCETGQKHYDRGR